MALLAGGGDPVGDDLSWGGDPIYRVRFTATPFTYRPSERSELSDRQLAASLLEEGKMDVLGETNCWQCATYGNSVTLPHSTACRAG